MGLWSRKNWLTLAALGCLIAVAMGAYGAHGADDHDEALLISTGAQYEFFHCLAVFACATLMQLGAKRARFAPAFFLGGAILFSGSLYALAFGAPNWVGVVTPLGGLAFLAGWGVLVWAARGVDPA